VGRGRFLKKPVAPAVETAAVEHPAFFIKVVASFSSKMAIVCIDYDDRNRFELNVCVLNEHKSWLCV
jgi:hypothetical protein